MKLFVAVVLALFACAIGDSVTVTLYSKTGCTDKISSESVTLDSCERTGTTDCPIPDESYSVSNNTVYQNVFVFNTGDKCSGAKTSVAIGLIDACVSAGRKREVAACASESVTETGTESAVPVLSLKYTLSSPASMTTYSVVLLSAGALAALFV